MAKNRFDKFADGTATDIIPSDFGSLTSFPISASGGSSVINPFGGLKNLETVEFSGNLTAIGHTPLAITTFVILFGNPLLTADNPTNLSEIRINEGTVSLQYGAFQAIPSVKTFYLPSTLRYIPTGETYPNESTVMTNSTFYSDIKIFQCNNTDYKTTFVIDNNNPYFYTHGNDIVTKDTYELIEGGSLTSIPNDIKIIGYASMKFANGITALVIPSGVELIKKGAFYGVSSLTSVTIPASVTEIKPLAFCSCSNLATIRFEHSASDSITLYTGTSGSFYGGKNARAVSIYTDNDYIKSLDWSSQNITPTFYHLDGTAWA